VCSHIQVLRNEHQSVNSFQLYQATKGAFMLNLRRQSQRFEMFIQNAVHGGTVYAQLFKFGARADSVNIHCACACYKRQVNLSARFFESFECVLCAMSCLIVYIFSGCDLAPYYVLDCMFVILFLVFTPVAIHTMVGIDRHLYFNLNH